MKWQQGRAALDKMLADGELERVQASREHADRLISQARRHLDSVVVQRSQPAEIAEVAQPLVRVPMGGWTRHRTRHIIKFGERPDIPHMG